MVESIYVCGLVAYDGTDYHGFQYQTDVPSIQGTLEDALAAFVTIDGRVVGSGRTDRGVHARGQVIAVRVAWKHSVAALQRAWNAHLPDAISVYKLALASDSFHPRFSAVTRTYRYTLVQADPARGKNDLKRSPLTDRFAWYLPIQLDLPAMSVAAGYIVGEHDFATFGQPPTGTSTVRTVTQAEWQIVETNLPSLLGYPDSTLVFTVTANAFLRHMVRNLAGAFVEVGAGRWTVSELTEALAACDRSRAAVPAPPQGLMLEQVQYHTSIDNLL